MNGRNAKLNVRRLICALLKVARTAPCLDQGPRKTQRWRLVPMICVTSYTRLFVLRRLFERHVER